MILDFFRGGKASPPISLLKISPNGVFEGLGKHSSNITDKSWWLCFNEYDVETSESTGVGIPLLLSLWFWEGPLQHSGFTPVFQEDCRGLLWQYRDLDSCNWRKLILSNFLCWKAHSWAIRQSCKLMLLEALFSLFCGWLLYVASTELSWGQGNPGGSYLLARCGGVCIAFLWCLKSTREKCVNCHFKTMGIETKEPLTLERRKGSV